MSALLKILSLCVTSAALGWLVVTYGGVISARTADSTLWSWGAVFALPMFVYVVAIWVRTARAGQWLGFSNLKIVCAFLGLPIILFVSEGARTVAEREQTRILRETRLNTEMGRYVALPRVPDPLRGMDGGNGVMRGKAVLIDLVHGKVSELQFQLPPELTPASPDEVGTVVHFDSVRDPANPTLWARRIRVIDLQAGTVVQNRTIPLGSSDSEVLNFLTALARDPASVQR